MASALGLGALPFTASAQQPSAAAASSTPLLFDGVTVVDVETGQRRTQQRVLVVGNRITAVGAASGVPVPKGAQVIEAKGRFLIPGLWDIHTHPMDDRRVYYLLDITNGVTGIRDAHSGQQPIDTALQWWHEILAGRQVGPPRQLISGPYEPMLPDEEIAERKAKGANFIKVYPFVPAIASALKREGLPFGGHVEGGGIGLPPGTEALEASDSGISIIDHINTSGDLRKICLGSAGSIEQCQPIADRFRKNNTWFAPTLLLFGTNNAVFQPVEKDTRALGPIRQRLDRFSLAFVASDTVLRRNIGPNDSVRLGVRGYMEIAQSVKLPILAGTDAAGAQLDSAGGGSILYGVVPGLAGFALHTELEALVAEGLTPLNALQSATLNPALMLRATDSLGTVAPGKLADLVLLDGDPLADIRNTSAIRAVVANGRYYDRAALDRMLAEVQAELKRRKKP